MESLAKVMELGYCRCRSEVDYISFQKANDTVTGVTARGRDLIKKTIHNKCKSEIKERPPHHFGENYPYYPTSLVAERKNDDIYGDDYEDLSNSSIRSWKFLEMIMTSSRVSFNSQRKSHLLEHLTLHSKEDSSKMLR
ncbi:hypothetical protein NPIL_53541 [Nephila pilipes]|uniref:Uncharacterized protein n=1 Tax=Nephila pilipes TaxID=299642 RepID=A0A8X6PE73_NEPPI|nr:hypothetical protein NPIL_53541 [Nephila pilipes]